MCPANREYGAILALLGAVCLLSSACGSADGGGPPSARHDSDNAILAGVAGTCRKLCCSAGDCANQGQCRPFDSASGTLGTCASSSAPSGLAAGSLPAGCWTRNTPACQPLSGQGCDAGEICDFDEGDESLDPVIICSSGIEAHADGEACDAVYGPYCQAGYHCVPKGS